MPNINGQFNEMKKYTAKNTAISPNFLVWKFCGKEQFPHSSGEGENTVFFAVSAKVLIQLKRGTQHRLWLSSTTLKLRQK